MATAKDFCNYINDNYSPFVEMRISEKYISDIKKESNDIIDIRIYSDWLNDYVGIGTIDWRSFEITLASDWLNYGIFNPVWTGDIIEMMLCDSEFTGECFDVNQYSIFTFINNLEDKTYNETVKAIIEHIHDSLVDSLFFKQFCYYVINNLYCGIDQEIEILKECLESCSASLKHNSFKNTIKVEKYERKKENSNDN